MAVSMLLLTSNTAFAEPSRGVSSCSGYAKDSIIQLFPVSGNGDIRQMQITSPHVVTSTGCIGPSGGWSILLDDSDSVFEEAYSMLLAAYLNNSKIVLKIDSSKTVCTLLHVRLKQW